MARSITAVDPLTGQVIEAQFIPGRELVPGAGTPANLYAMVPQSVWHQVPAWTRLWLALHFALRSWDMDEPGGWYRLTPGLADRAGLGPRSSRRNAVNRLEKMGLIEVRRTPGKASLLRLIDPGHVKPAANRRRANGHA